MAPPGRQTFQNTAMERGPACRNPLRCITISRNLEKALKFLNNFGDKLYLSQAVMESAAYIYRKAALKKLAKGRSTLGLVGASLYAACRETATLRLWPMLRTSATFRARM